MDLEGFLTIVDYTSQYSKSYCEIYNHQNISKVYNLWNYIIVVKETKMYVVQIQKLIKLHNSTINPSTKKVTPRERERRKAQLY